MRGKAIIVLSCLSCILLALFLGACSKKEPANSAFLGEDTNMVEATLKPGVPVVSPTPMPVTEQANLGSEDSVDSGDATVFWETDGSAVTQFADFYGLSFLSMEAGAGWISEYRAGLHDFKRVQGGFTYSGLSMGYDQLWITGAITEYALWLDNFDGTAVTFSTSEAYHLRELCSDRIREYTTAEGGFGWGMRVVSYGSEEWMECIRLSSEESIIKQNEHYIVWEQAVVDVDVDSWGRHKFKALVLLKEIEDKPVNEGLLLEAATLEQLYTLVDDILLSQSYVVIVPTQDSGIFTFESITLGENVTLPGVRCFAVREIEDRAMLLYLGNEALDSVIGIGGESVQMGLMDYRRIGVVGDLVIYQHIGLGEYFVVYGVVGDAGRVCLVFKTVLGTAVTESEVYEFLSGF